MAAWPPALHNDAVTTAPGGIIPLMCREAEMDRILAGLRGSTSVSFVLAGPAGVGKTRIANEASRFATSLRFDVVQVVGSRAIASIPFGPFAPFLPVSGPTPQDRLGLLRLVNDAITARATPDHRVLLTVDDAQFLDDGSAALVHQLVQTGSCGLLATVRTPGPVPDPVTALWKDSLAERIDLRAWNEGDTGQVLAASLGGPVARATVRRLWELSQGNALYLRELIRGAVESGTLGQADGIWSLAGPLSPPDRLVELVASRLRGLAPDTIAVIEFLAVGEPLGVAILAEVAGPGGLEDAEAQGLARVAQDGRRAEARLAHPVYGEALRQSLPRTRWRRISAMLADAIEATGARRREDLLRLATWRLDADSPADPVVLTRAARRAQEMFDMDLAGRLARAALDSGGGVAAGLALGEALFRTGRHRAAEAEAVLAQTARLCQTDADIARIASARAHNFHNLLADSASATAVLDEALAVVKDETARLQLLGRLATFRVFEEDPEGALAAAAPLLASDDDLIVSRGSYSSSIALAILGRSAEALAVAENGLQANRRASTPNLPEAQLIGAVFALLAAGSFAKAEQTVNTAYQASSAVGDKEGEATWLLLAGVVSVEQGQLARAVAEFRDAVSVNRELHDLTALRWCLAGVALAEAMRGHGEAAGSAAAESGELQAGPMTLWEADLMERCRAWLSVGAGELSHACEVLLAAADRAAGHRMRIAEARLLHDVARLGRPGDVAARLSGIAGEVDGELVAVLAAHVGALARGDAAGLEAAARGLSGLGAMLLAAEAYQAAAESYRSNGYLRAAAACARSAADLAAACGNPRTPGLAHSEQTERLTRREREVAGLAASGVTSREIAAKLVLSVRTVDNHLQSAYTKLGVTSREELARMLSLEPRPGS